jgi:hypothetical protein
VINRSSAFRWTFSSFVIGSLGLLAFALPAMAQREGGSERPEVGKAVKFDISPPLRTITPRLNMIPKKAEDDHGPGGPIDDTRHDPDPVLQSTIGTGVFGGQDLLPAAGANFNGMSGTAQPPDPNGDIGPNHYVQMVNSRFQIFNRQGVSLFGPANINTLFSGFTGPCEFENAGDPVVLYDQLADRWLLSQFSDSAGPFFNCIAISVTGDPTGAYYRYAFQAPSFPDYPKYGVWPDGYYLNTREGGLLGLYALERSQMLIGNPAARFVKFTASESGANPTNGFLNADLDGFNLPPAGAPNYLIGTRDNGAGATGDAVVLFKFHVDWVTPANSTFSAPIVLPIASFDTIFPCTPSARACIAQPPAASGVKLDILSYRQRPTFRLAYRNFGTHESLVTTQSVEASTGIAGMRWWEVRDPGGTPVLFQEGTYGPGATDGIHRWMGSIAMDRQGNMALGYSVSDAVSVFPGIRYTGRLAADPLGQMPQGEGTIVNGGGAQTTSSNRWGDYSSLNVDPLDDCRFWYTTEYYAATSPSGYSTKIASFKFPECLAPSPRSRGDFDADGRTDTAVFRPAEGNWYLNRSTEGFAALNWGLATDTIVPGDWDGDNRADMVVFRPAADSASLDFYILNSNGFTWTGLQWGIPDDIPISGDYDGDGRADAAVFRPAEGAWYIRNSSDGAIQAHSFGLTGDVPLAIDNDGDGKTNIAVFRPSDGKWYIARPTGVPAQNFDTIPFGLSTDLKVPADYDGDNKDDIAVFRPSDGRWYILRSRYGSVEVIGWGSNGDVPVPGDYDGDSRDDPAVYRNGTWHILQSTAGYTATTFGIASDVPVPKGYIP